MLLSWINSIQVLLAVLSALLGFYVFSTRRCYALAAFLFGLAVHNILRLAGETSGQQLLVDLGNCMRFLYAPLVYFATRELLYKDFHYQRTQLPHLLPFAGAIVITLMAPAAGTQLGGLVGMLVIAYLLAAYRLVWQFRRIVNQTRSTGLPEGLLWLSRTLHVYAVLILLELARFALGLVIPAELSAVAHMGFLVLVCLLLCYLVFQGMQRPALLPPAEASEQAVAKPQDSGDTRTPDRDLASRLTRFMEEEKPFLDPQLSVSELAERLGVPGRNLSEAINDVHNCNFSDYINQARAGEATRLMADPAHAQSSLLDIGLAAGFNSKTSFNVMFKRHTGATPSAYRKSLG